MRVQNSKIKDGSGLSAVLHLPAKVQPGVGVLLSPLLPALTAAGLSLLLVPESAPPVAFASGVLGVLVGADLLRLKQVLAEPVKYVAIGGAGTLDGVLLAGMAATLLAYPSPP